MQEKSYFEGFEEPETGAFAVRDVDAEVEDTGPLVDDGAAPLDASLSAAFHAFPLNTPVYFLSAIIVSCIRAFSAMPGIGTRRLG